MIPAPAQCNAVEILRLIEHNNPALIAAKAEAEAETLSNRAGIRLSDPEVEFNYMRGGNDLGNRHDLRVSQSFDYPSLSGMRKNKMVKQNESVALRYAERRLEVLLEAKLTLIDLSSRQTLRAALLPHERQAQILADAFSRRLAAGSATRLDLNKACLHLATVEARITEADVEIRSALDALASLNGGTPVFPEESDGFCPAVLLIPDELPSDFESWYAKTTVHWPGLASLERQLEADRLQLKIDKTSWVPDLTVGYLEEIGRNDRYRGLTAGLTIPLWSNAPRIRATAAGVSASKLRLQTAERQFHGQLLRLFNLAKGWKETSDRLHAALEQHDSRTDLLEAEARGEISLIEGLYETELYFEVLEQAETAERNYRRALAELTAASL